jgi:hypothetical protein
MTKSLYADRDTVGTIALKARQSNDIPTVGDLGHELMPSLVEDLNNAIESNPYDNRPFYIIIHEKKDLLLKNVINRRVLTTEKRPYPEPNITVFKTFPKQDKTVFCWSLPHQTLFNQVLANPQRYCKEQINDIKAYLAENLEHFGIKKVGMTKDKRPIIKEIPDFKDRSLKNGRDENTFKTSLHLP